MFQQIVGHLGPVTGSDPGASARFFPLATQWLTHKISLANYATASDILIKIEGTSASGQVLWLDNIWVSTNVLSSEEAILLDNLSIFPNPTSNLAKFNLELIHESDVSISIFNLSGQKVINLDSQILPSGSHTLEAPVSELPDGMYNARISINGKIQNLRFTVAH